MTSAKKVTKLSAALSQQLLEVRTEEEIIAWIRAAEKELGGISWQPLGGDMDNVHTVEVSSDPALASVEKYTNAIDALLDFMSRRLGETATSPHEAASKWFKVPEEGLSAMSEEDRRKLADLIRVTMIESGSGERPTILIQDQGTGQRPDDFPQTLLSLHKSNKKGKMHQMGQYNAGGSASYKFSKATVVVSRLAPALLEDHDDETGATIVRYNPLDPDKWKTGVYEYMVAKDGSILRLDIPQLPELGFGTYIKMVEYLMPKYSKAAFGPQNSLWHLIHSALPEPPLPIRIIETRKDRFKGMKGDVERRVVTGLRHLLSRKSTADYQDERKINLGSSGKVMLRYFVLNEGTDPNAYTTSDHALALTNNGQRQGAKDRSWLQRKLGLNFLYKRLIVLVDASGLSNATKREVFSSTREHSVDSPAAMEIFERVVQELKDDEDLYALDALEKQRVLDSATRTTTEKVKKQLAGQIVAMLKGELTAGTKGGKKKERTQKAPKKPKGPPRPPRTDDSDMLDVPDTLKILTDPLRLEPGETAGLRLEINAKNGFLPKYASGLSVVIGPELKDHVKVATTGSLLGGRVRVTLEASKEAPIASTDVKVALVVPELGVLLTATGKIEIVEPKEEPEDESPEGGEPNIEINWVKRDKWESLNFNEDSVGKCYVNRDDPSKPDAITKVEWVLNQDFAALERVIIEKKLSEATLKTMRERYEYPVALGLFKQFLAEEAKEREADAEGRNYNVPDDYVDGEKARLARAVLMALEPDIQIEMAGEAA